MRSPKVALVLIAGVLCLANLVVTFWRSTIPIELDGTIESIEFLSEDNPGIDDIYVMKVDDSEIHVDRDVARQLTSNVHVAKEAWSTELVVGRYAAARRIDLRPSEDFTGTAATMPVVLAVLLVLLFASRPQRKA